MYSKKTKKKELGLGKNKDNYIHIIQKNKIFFYKKNKNKINKDLSTRINNIYIPPAYKNIFLNKKKDDKIQLIAIDNKGRFQYFYNDKFKKKIESRKYKALSSLILIIQKIETDNNKVINKLCNYIKKININSSLTILKKHYNKLFTYSNIINILILLLIHTNSRIGTLKYKTLYGTHGLSTLCLQNFIFYNKKDKNEKPISILKIKNINNVNLKLSYIGKKGVFIINYINSNYLKQILYMFILLKLKINKYSSTNQFILSKKHLKKQQKTTDFIFSYISKNNLLSETNILIKSSDIKDYIQNNYDKIITPKMFRTYYANYTMINYINSNLYSDLKKSSDLIKTDKQLHNFIKKQILNSVSNKLNNTPSICFNKYLNHNLFDLLINSIIKSYTTNNSDLLLSIKKKHKVNKNDNNKMIHYILRKLLI